MLLSEINPERADTLFARAYMYGDSRVIVGAHWQTDVDAGRMGACIGYGILQSNPTFREDMKAAQQEFPRKNNKK